ncbi:MAG TPA: DUF2062 domain-containing protein [Sphingopyxis sp.]|nr:DUF2062 domain-containing protein [Sphingopyxis sp.]
MRNWFINLAPDRDALLHNRWLAPIASRLAPSFIWQFNRRSIARGIALGLFAGFLVPIGQIVIAALLAASVRANVLIASAATLVTNPLTFPPVYYAAYRTGSWLLAKFGLQGSGAQEGVAVTTSLWSSMGSASLATFLGLLLFATLSSLIAFTLVHLVWRLTLFWRWRGRRKAG